LQKQQKIRAEKMPSKGDVTTSHQLLMKAFAEKNIAFNVASSKYFQAYVAHISDMRYKAPSRYYLVQALDVVNKGLDSRIRKLLHSTPFLAGCADSWTHAGKHITAITGGPSDSSLFLSSFELSERETAVAVAPAIHACFLESMGLPANLSSTHESYPNQKVSVFTTDTTNLMPATARELREKFVMFRGMLWLSCFCHCANLFLLDQLKVPCFSDFLAHSRQITATFRNSNNFRKLFLTCALLHFFLMHGVQNCDVY
jgi:hypothetical protein